MHVHSHPSIMKFCVKMIFLIFSSGPDSSTNVPATSQIEINLNVTLYMSGVPSSPLERIQYVKDFESAVILILSISADWHFKVIDLSISRRLGLLSETEMCLVFTSSSADAAAVTSLRNKLASQSFFDALKGLGFLASTSRQQPINISTGRNEMQSAIIIGVSLPFGIFTVLLFLCVYLRISPHRMLSKTEGRAGSVDNDRTGTAWDTKEVTMSENYIRDSNHAYSELASSFLVEKVGKAGINEADYSIEIEEVLLLFAELGIRIKSLLDACSRKDIETYIEHSNEISAHNRAAMLQLLSKIEIEEELTILTHDRIEILQRRMKEGPLTENHSVILKLICESEREDATVNASSIEAMEVTDGRVADKPAKSCLSRLLANEAEIKETRVSSNTPLLELLMLLKRCDLEPSYLLRSESRKVIEDSLTSRQGQLLPEHLAVLQLISKAEIDSDLSVDPARRLLLETRIRQGPLDAEHLSAAQLLAQTEEAGKIEGLLAFQASHTLHQDVETGPQNSTVQKDLREHTTLYAEVVLAELNLATTPSPSGAVATGRRHVAPNFKDLIAGLETPSSLLSHEEKSALQLIELRAKTARIKQGLPDWVKKGLVPPRRNRSPPAIRLEQQLASHTVGRDSCATRDALQISCDVRADIGFLSSNLQPASPIRPGRDSIERLLFGEERRVEAFSCRDDRSTPGLQAEAQASAPLPDEGLERIVPYQTDAESAAAGPAPPPPAPSLLARFFGALGKLLSACMDAMLSLCRGGPSPKEPPKQTRLQR
jgi:hypothetical protein